MNTFCENDEPCKSYKTEEMNPEYKNKDFSDHSEEDEYTSKSSKEEKNKKNENEISKSI